MAQSGDRIERLRAIPIFADLPDRALDQIAGVLTEFAAAAGQVLIQQGQPGSGLLIVDQGTVVVERPGRRRIELGPGEFLGELALLTPEGMHRARVRTKTATVLLAMTRQDFGKLLEEEPRIAVAMLPVLAGRLSGADTD
jgi:CRP/FNR family cyclic AMP-dependent transcriptional regulator